MGACNALGNLFRLAIVACVVIAIIMQWALQYDCDYALFADNETSGFGVWFTMVDSTCSTTVYDPTETDPFIVSARSCLTLAMISAFIGGVMVTFEWCICEVCCAGCLEMLCFMGAWILSACVNLLYLSELCTGIAADDFQGSAAVDAAQTGNLCVYGPGSTLNAVATILYLAVCIMLCCTPEPDPIWRQ